MPFTVIRPAQPPLLVDADDHRLEGDWHVFRRDTLVLGRPRSVVALRLPAAGVVRVVPARLRLVGAPSSEDAGGMSRRYAVPLDQLEAQSHVADSEQLEAQAEPRLHAPLLDGPHLHPFADGATAADADGE